MPPRRRHKPGDWMMCAHANEVPYTCPCPPTCICKTQCDERTTKRQLAVGQRRASAAALAKRQLEDLVAPGHSASDVTVSTTELRRRVDAFVELLLEAAKTDAR